MNENTRIGYAMCGSFCTMSKAVAMLETLCGAYKNVTPIMSETAYSTDTRFGNAASFIARAEAACEKEVIHTIAGAEPIGPRGLLDILIISPCTGNTLSKLASGVTDSAVTMAAKAQLRNERPVLIALATNDALSGSATSLGRLLDKKNVYFVPFCQDDPQGKPSSLTARLELIESAADAALCGKQLQPLLCCL